MCVVKRIIFNSSRYAWRKRGMGWGMDLDHCCWTECRSNMRRKFTSIKEYEGFDQFLVSRMWQPFVVYKLLLLLLSLSLLSLLLLVFSPDLWCFSRSSKPCYSSFPLRRDITLFARYKQYQGRLATVHVQKCQADLNSETRPLHSFR